MFQENKTHLQKDMFGILNTMPESMKKHALKSEECHFYNLICPSAETARINIGVKPF